MNELMDSELVVLAKQGEARAFNILVDRYQSKVTGLVYRYVKDTDTALDLVQDIFFKIFKNLVKFKGDSKFSSWLFRIATNESIDYLRKVKVRKEQSLDAYQEVGFDVADSGSEAQTAENYEAREEKKRIVAALDRLPDKHKAVVVMKVYEEMTFDQISEIIEEPVSTVKSRLYKSLKLIGGELRQQEFITARGKK